MDVSSIVAQIQVICHATDPNTDLDPKSPLAEEIQKIGAPFLEACHELTVRMRQYDQTIRSGNIANPLAFLVSLEEALQEFRVLSLKNLEEWLVILRSVGLTQEMELDSELYSTLKIAVEHIRKRILQRNMEKLQANETLAEELTSETVIRPEIGIHPKTETFSNLNNAQETVQTPYSAQILGEVPVKNSLSGEISQLPEETQKFAQKPYHSGAETFSGLGVPTHPNIPIPPKIPTMSGVPSGLNGLHEMNEKSFLQTPPLPPPHAGTNCPEVPVNSTISPYAVSNFERVQSSVLPPPPQQKVPSEFPEFPPQNGTQNGTFTPPATPASSGGKKSEGKIRSRFAFLTNPSLKSTLVRIQILLILITCLLSGSFLILLFLLLKLLELSTF